MKNVMEADKKTHEQAVFELDKELTSKEFRILDLE